MGQVESERDQAFRAESPHRLLVPVILPTLGLFVQNIGVGLVSLIPA